MKRDKTGAQDRFIKCGVHSAAYSAKEKSEGIRASLGERGARQKKQPIMSECKIQIQAHTNSCCYSSIIPKPHRSQLLPAAAPLGLAALRAYYG